MSVAGQVVLPHSVCELLRTHTSATGVAASRCRPTGVHWPRVRMGKSQACELAGDVAKQNSEKGKLSCAVHKVTDLL